MNKAAGDIPATQRSVLPLLMLSGLTLAPMAIVAIMAWLIATHGLATIAALATVLAAIALPVGAAAVTLVQKLGGRRLPEVAAAA